MNKRDVYAYYESHPELEDLYLKKDPEYRKREKELRKAISTLEPLVQELGKDAWLKFDRVLAVHSRCEERALLVMYVKGALDMADQIAKKIKEG